MPYILGECNRKQQKPLPHGLKNYAMRIAAALINNVVNLIVSVHVHHLCTKFSALLRLIVLDKQGEKRIGTRGFEPLTPTVSR